MTTISEARQKKFEYFISLPEPDKTEELEGLEPGELAEFQAYISAKMGSPGSALDAKEQRVTALQAEAVTKRVDRLEELEEQMKTKNRELEEKDRKIKELEETGKALAEKIKEPETKEPETGDPLVDMAERPLKPTQGQNLAKINDVGDQAGEEDDEELELGPDDNGRANLMKKVPKWLHAVANPFVDFYIDCKRPVEEEMAEESEKLTKLREARERLMYPEHMLNLPRVEDLPSIEDADMYGLQMDAEKRMSPPPKMSTKEGAPQATETQS